MENSLTLTPFDMSVIRLTPADLSALRQGKTIERPAGPTLKLKLSEEALEMEQERQEVETHQEAYFRELRLARVTQQYLEGMHRITGFEHSSIGIALAKKMFSLSPPLCDHDA